jgi:hypothetical protein
VAHDSNYFVGSEKVLVHNEPTPPQLPGRVLYNADGIRVVHNYGNVGRGVGTAVEHAPIHYHVSHGGKEYRVFPSGRPLQSSAAPPQAVQDVFNANKSRFQNVAKRIGKWFKFISKGCG